MVESIDRSLSIQFSDVIHKETQQMMARLRPYVIVKQMTGDIWAYDGLGRIEAREVTGRNVPATFDDITHNRRKISRKRFVVNLPVDAADVRGSLLDANSEYPATIVAAAMRQYDRVVYGAAFANVLTGRDFETTVTFANDGGTTVNATAGLTYEKMLEIKQNFIDNDVGTDMSETLYGTISGKETTQLMGEEELTSGDYRSSFVVEKGVMAEALGMKLITFGGSVPSPILNVTSGTRDLLFASSRGICLGISKEMSVKIQERSDYIETTQVQIVFEIGAVRTEGALIQKVQTTS